MSATEQSKKTIISSFGKENTGVNDIIKTIITIGKIDIADSLNFDINNFIRI